MDLKTSLSRLTCGKQFEQSEADLTLLMKQLAVRHQNPAVHVQEFLGLTQQADEGVRHYLTRLRGVAGRCDFNVHCTPCNQPVSYQDSVVRFKLIQGLTDSEIKEHILSEEDKSLDDTVKAIEAKESGKLARCQVARPKFRWLVMVKRVLPAAATAVVDMVTARTKPVVKKTAQPTGGSA